MSTTTSDETEALTRVIHARNEFDYDDCQHGTFSGGHMHGEPYAMCERMAAHLLASDWLAARAAEAWDEGWNASADYMSDGYDGPDDPPNPYESPAPEPTP